MKLNKLVLSRALIPFIIASFLIVLTPCQVSADNEIAVYPESGRAGGKISIKGRDLFLNNVFVYFDTNSNGKFDDGEPAAEREPSWITGDWRATLRTPRRIPPGVYAIYAEFSYTRYDGIVTETYSTNFTVRKP
ncbi:MAG: hypothetical protein FJ008_07640 [Chloroflexi bacterium]|nr:hypothetical protein [Chloroflexota bacterium]MBM3155190.1 hypothetical protein [Chloroflexota bacterium]MBM3173358.1 hypothetical protein [Chloroflexota bacterium]MBM3175598.1 hypothetical protein [Chloroflexota bacterium]MBM4450222.1 hypothetical protein [Chloroflexota bacterium]